MFMKRKVYHSWFKMKNVCAKCVREMRPFDQGPLPLSVDTDIIHVINDTRPSPSVFAKRSKTGR